MQILCTSLSLPIQAVVENDFVGRCKGVSVFTIYTLPYFLNYLKPFKDEHTCTYNLCSFTSCEYTLHHFKCQD